MNQPLVSIIVSCHNRAHLLTQTLESIFAQSYRPVEIVVVDDGSTDATPELMKAYGDKIRYVRQKNQGVAVARTTGGRLARGEFIAFQDDDDLMAPDGICHLIDGFKKYPKAVLSVGDYAFLDPEGNLTGEKSQFQIHEELTGTDNKPIIIGDGYAAVLWPRLTPLPHTTLFRKKDAENIGWFDTRFSYACSDTDFFARLAQLGSIIYVPQVVSLYRAGHTSIWQNKIMALCSRLLLFEKHIQSIGNNDSALRNHLKKRLCTVLKQIAIYRRQRHPATAISENLVVRGLAQLDFMNRINYRLYSTFILPIRFKMLGTRLDVSLSDHVYHTITSKLRIYKN
jgi:glycosyltransferase involved in cell wall biosynthesis